MRNMIRLLVSALMTIICAAVSIAQTNRGGISGTIFDKAGAVIPGATVIVTNSGTNESVRLTTSESGAFSVPLLDPVEYRITVEATGFKKATVDKIKVDTATTATINVTLEAGGAIAEVTVTAEAPIINAESGTSGQTITERQISELPLNNRSVLDLALTVANVRESPGLKIRNWAPTYLLPVSTSMSMAGEPAARQSSPTAPEIQASDWDGRSSHSHPTLCRSSQYRHQISRPSTDRPGVA